MSAIVVLQISNSRPTQITPFVPKSHRSSETSVPGDPTKPQSDSNTMLRDPIYKASAHALGDIKYSEVGS